MPKRIVKIRIGILLHGNKIWLSELVSIISVAAFLGTLLLFSISILRNEFILYRSSKLITALRVEMVSLEHELEQLKEKNRIAELLCSFAGSRVPTKTIYQLSELVYLSSRQFGYDPSLLLAVIHVESVFDPDAQGRYRSGDLSGALGLMQLKLSTAQEVANRLNMGTLTKEDLFKPEINLVLGVAYLTRLISRFKSFKLGLLAYNLGPETVRSTLSKKEPLPISYYQKVLRSYYKIQQIANRSAALHYATQECK